MTNEHKNTHQQLEDDKRKNPDIAEALYALQEVQAIYRETIIIMREAEIALHHNNSTGGTQ
jgi:hypothetical protein